MDGIFRYLLSGGMIELNHYKKMLEIHFFWHDKWKYLCKKNELQIKREIFIQLVTQSRCFGTDDDEEILNLFNKKILDNNLNMQQENNALVSGIDEINNFLH